MTSRPMRLKRRGHARRRCVEFQAGALSRNDRPDAGKGPRVISGEGFSVLMGDGLSVLGSYCRVVAVAPLTYTAWLAHAHTGCQVVAL